MKFNWLKSRQTKYGAYSATYILVGVAILVALNYLADRYNKTYDATENKLYSLSDQTLKILSNLDRDVKIYYFDQRSRFSQARTNLVRYSNASHRVSVDYIDPDSKPDLAQAMNVRTYGTVLVEMGPVREEAKSTDEEDITNAIIKTMKGEEKTACFLTGHGEADPENSERDGFSAAKTEIEGANYMIRTVSLLENPEMPAECTLLIIAGPEKSYLEPELEIIKKYVEGGGSALVMLDYDKSSEWVEFLAGWGIQVGDDIVIDLSGVGQFFGLGPLAPLVANYESHPISEVMGNVASFFPMSRSVEAGDAVDKWNVQSLFRTTPGSFATEDFSLEGGSLERNPEKEREGPISLAVAATYDVPAAEAAGSESSGEGEDAGKGSESEATEEKEGRVVVVGTSMFARNNFVERGGNVDLFLNMLNWLSSDEDLISIRPKDPESTPLNLTQAQMSRLFWGTVVGLPLLIVGAGIRVWWIRR